MKKSFILFSLIGIVAIGMSFNSCDKGATSASSDYSHEENWLKLEQQLEQLNAKYEHLTTEKVEAKKKLVVEDGELELRSKYKGVKSGKLMYQMLQLVFSNDLKKYTQGMSNEEREKHVVAEIENITSIIDELQKAPTMNTEFDDIQTTQWDDQFTSIHTDFVKLSIDLELEDLRHYTEEYIEIINTTLQDPEERLIQTIQISMTYYICAFWSREGAYLLE